LNTNKQPLRFSGLFAVAHDQLMFIADSAYCG